MDAVAINLLEVVLLLSINSSSILVLDFFIPFPFPNFGNRFFFIPFSFLSSGSVFFHSLPFLNFGNIFSIPFPFLSFGNGFIHTRSRSRSPLFWVPLEYLGYDGSNELRGQSVARRIEPTRNKSFYRMDKEIDEKVIFLHKTLRVVILVIVVIVNQKSDWLTKWLAEWLIRSPIKLSWTAKHNVTNGGPQLTYFV